MLRKNIVQKLDTATSWKVFGLDLAKHDLAVAAIPADGSDVQYVKYNRAFDQQIVGCRSSFCYDLYTKWRSITKYMYI